MVELLIGGDMFEWIRLAIGVTVIYIATALIRVALLIGGPELVDVMKRARVDAAREFYRLKREDVCH
jgi:hypothetical protein